jgi:gentisate 1,2-dioxygenase
MARVEATQEQREEFYAEISPYNLAPMWEKMHELITREPTRTARAGDQLRGHLWEVKE